MMLRFSGGSFTLLPRTRQEQLLTMYGPDCRFEATHLEATFGQSNEDMRVKPREEDIVPRSMSVLPR